MWVDQIKSLEVESAAGPGFFNDMIPGVTIAGEVRFPI
jgi:hypothetical protein